MASNQPLNGEIAKRVERTRKAAGLTQEQLALAAGISDRTYARLIGGNYDWKAVDVESIATVIGVDFHDLLPERAA